MTRLDRIIKAFNDYDEIVENLVWDNNDDAYYDRKLKMLREEVRMLVAELERYGCRRRD